MHVISEKRTKNERQNGIKMDFFIPIVKILW